jgi:hypothetical protein
MSVCHTAFIGACPISGMVCDPGAIRKQSKYWTRQKWSIVGNAVSISTASRGFSPECLPEAVFVGREPVITAETES